MHGAGSRTSSLWCSIQTCERKQHSGDENRHIPSHLWRFWRLVSDNQVVSSASELKPLEAKFGMRGGWCLWLYNLYNYTPVNEHCNGKWTLWRGISFLKCWFSIAMLVYWRIFHLHVTSEPCAFCLTSGQEVSKCRFVSFLFPHFLRVIPRDPITERQMMILVYNHLQNARYLCSIAILSFGEPGSTYPPGNSKSPTVVEGNMWKFPGGCLSSPIRVHHYGSHLDSIEMRKFTAKSMNFLKKN